MKKQVMIIGTATFLFIGGAFFTSCDDSPKSSEEAGTHTHEHKEDGHDEKVDAGGGSHAEAEHKHYQCPMKCEKDKVYEEKGNCPVCKMEMKEVEA